MSGFTPILWMLVPIPGLLALVSLGAWATDWDATVLRRPR
jgi:hypothetical protein